MDTGFATSVLRSAFHPVTLTIWAAGTFIATLGGPFDTYTYFNWPERAAFWGILNILGILIGFAIRFGFARKVTQRVDWLWEVRGAVLFTVLFSPIVLGTAYIFTGTVDPLPPVWMVGATTLLTYGTVSLVRHHLGIEAGLVAGTSHVWQPALAKRLQGDATPPIARLSMDSRYVQVFMEDGSSARLLMRFADAVEEMAGVRGFCIHRSHWVAAHAILDVRREGGREMVTMTDGAVMPVGGTYRDNLVVAGFLDSPDA